MRLLCVGHEIWYVAPNKGHDEAHAVRSWFLDADAASRQVRLYTKFTGQLFPAEASEMTGVMAITTEKIKVGVEHEVDGMRPERLPQPRLETEHSGVVVGHFVTFVPDEVRNGKHLRNQVVGYISVRIFDANRIQTLQCRIGSSEVTPDEDIPTEFRVTYKAMREAYPLNDIVHVYAADQCYWAQDETPVRAGAAS